MGGTSLEMALSKFLGPEDIITPISLEDEEARFEWGFRVAQNFQKNWSEMGVKDLGRVMQFLVGKMDRRPKRQALNRRRLPRRFWNHMSAREARSLLGEQVWKDYFKLTVERNPWDKVVSMFYWDQKGKRQGQPFEEFVRSGMAYQSEYDRYSIGGIPQVDKIVRYENLEQDLGEVSERVGFPENVYEVMKHIRAKGGFRKEGTFRDLYDEDLKRIIGFQYAREIALLGYCFD
ncbi:MAG: hypothetical protein GWN24_19455 [Nitrospinaceae bacterium]|nr:hypothetical protein [Nitrospinaceae bacterium]